MEGKNLRKELERKYSRRYFLADVGLGIIGGGGAYFGSNEILNYGKRKLEDIVRGAEREIRRLAIDIRSLSGILETNLNKEVKTLKENYNKRLKIYEELGVASPAEIKELEKILNNLEKLREHYNFLERLKIFKDRIDERLCSLDKKIEEKYPLPLRKLNDSIRKLFGKPSGSAGEEYRKNILERLKALGEIYDVNEDNRTAQQKVVKKLNDYLKNPTLSKEEKEAYLFLRNYMHKSPSEVKRYLRNIENYSIDSKEKQLLLSLKASIKKSEEVYQKIEENKNYLLRLQEKIKEGIKLKEEMRKRSVRNFEKYEQEVNNRIRSLRESVDKTIEELKKKGYPIETRSDYINKDSFTEEMSQILNYGTKAISGVLGALTGALLYSSRRKGRKIRALRKALDEAITLYNQEKNNYIADQEINKTQKDLNNRDNNN